MQGSMDSNSSHTRLQKELMAVRTRLEQMEQQVSKGRMELGMIHHDLAEQLGSRKRFSISKRSTNRTIIVLYTHIHLVFSLIDEYDIPIQVHMISSLGEMNSSSMKASQ